MKKILVVDDDKQNCQQVKDLLSNSDCSVGFILKPEILFPRLQEDPADLILLDVNMPGTDGLEVLKKIKQHPNFQEIPVIMLTGEIGGRMLADCLQNGARDYVNKPIDELVLKARVKSVMALKTAMEERQTILKSVHDGMILIKKNLKTGKNYSAVLKDILMKHEPGDKDFSELIGEILPAERREKLDIFLKLLFRNEHSPETLDQLNPLREVHASFKTDRKQNMSKYLRFHFDRVWKGGNIEQIMVVIQDVTDQVLLAGQLERSERRKKEQKEQIFNLLQADPAMLAEFLEDLDNELTALEHMIAESTAPNGNDLPAYFARFLHAAKGDAGAVGLDFMENTLHECEDRLAGQGADGLFVAIENMELTIRNLYRETDTLLERMLEFRDSFREAKTQSGAYLLKALENTIRNISGVLQKEVDLDLEGFDRDALPVAHRKTLKDILLQLTRNSLSHGLETSAERQKLGKPERGKITISGGLSGGFFEIQFRDDGRGLAVEKLRAAAIASGRYRDAELSLWDESRLARLIFEPGVTTAKKAELHAGRGMGMDLARDRLETIGGRLEVAFVAGEFCEFQISLPLEPKI